MRKLINIIFIVILLISCIGNVLLVNRLDKSIDVILETKLSNYKTVDTVIVDSLIYDTIYFNHFDTMKLETIKKDTITKLDSIFVLDSVEVFIPINTYKFDTTLNQTHINLICEGFDVRLNTLLVENLKTPTIKENKPKRWYNNFGLGVGIGITYVDKFRLVPTFGISYNLFSF
jgi:hypothetical protein